MDFAAVFNAGHSYQDFLAKYGTEEHRRRWGEVHARVALSPAQRELLSGFKRQMKLVVMAGAWCGDCVQQCPIFEHFAAAASPGIIASRYVDRDADAAVAAELSCCGAARVPSVLFLNEDNQPIGRYGDRTLSKYRQMVADQLGLSCPTGIVPPQQSLLDAVTQDWLNEFERLQLMLRTSPRLRQKHND
jgi:hypothetical protein